MKKSKILFRIGILMILIAIIFVEYALNHLEASIIFPIIGTTGFYRIYIIVALDVLILTMIMKAKNK